jgi:hypothetical protein
MILGFTGTRKGTTPAQRAALPSVLATLPERVLLGAAPGADRDFYYFLLCRDPRQIIELWPAFLDQLNWSNRECYRYPAVSSHGIHDPLFRNKEIAERCDHLLACPAEDIEQLRSGTWATVRYARKAKKPITFIFPDGTVKEEK